MTHCTELPNGLTGIARSVSVLIAIVVLNSEMCFAQQNVDGKLLKEAQQKFKPLPKDAGTKENPVEPNRVALGRMLFFDPRVSIDGVGSCVRCHQPALYGVDALPTSRGVGDVVLPRNAPTVLNSALHFTIHWDGVFDSVETQARKALNGPAFGNPDQAVPAAKLKSIAGYPELFKKAFPDQADPVTVENWGLAIGAYERTLMTPSRFDDFLEGKNDALSEKERRGLRRFLDLGCADCHEGPGVGGTKFQKFGVTEEYWKKTLSAQVDKGRFNVTKQDGDLYMFKVPSLRNVAMTPPFFHDGSVKTLPAAIQVMGSVQLDTKIDEEAAQEIATFLGSLTGTIPESFSVAPVLPSGGFDPKLK